MIHRSYNIFNDHLAKWQINSGKNNRTVTSIADFEIGRLECIEEDRLENAGMPLRFKSFEILWIQKGGGFITIDLQKHMICDNMVICIFPDQLVLLDATGNLEGYRVSFSPNFLLQAEEQTPLSFADACYDQCKLNIFYPDVYMQQELMDILELMFKEFKNYFLHRLQVLKGFFKIFLFHLLPHIKAATHHMPERDTLVVKKFMALIKEHYLTKKMVSDYARELYISPNYLNIMVKKVTGYTAGHHIRQLIILEAKRQAMYSGLSMKEVASSLGFNDYAHFSKFFKNNSGMNFTCFKNRIYEIQGY